MRRFVPVFVLSLLAAGRCFASPGAERTAAEGPPCWFSRSPRPTAAELRMAGEIGPAGPAERAQSRHPTAAADVRRCPGRDECGFGPCRGHDAKADMVVFGQVQATGPRIRVSGQVLDVPTGNPLADLSAAGAIDDLFPLEDALSRQVVQRVPPSLVLAMPPAAGQSEGNAGPPATRPASQENPDVGLPLEGTTTQGPVSPGDPSDANMPEYYSYTYPDYGSYNSRYPLPYPYTRYGYPDYYYGITGFYSPDLFFFDDFDRFHHHHFGGGHDHGGDNFHPRGISRGGTGTGAGAGFGRSFWPRRTRNRRRRQPWRWRRRSRPWRRGWRWRWGRWSGSMRVADGMSRLQRSDNSPAWRGGRQQSMRFS